MKVDTIVLGAGVVGISVALHLQKAGRATLLVDRRAPGEETSYGNAGLIQREGVYPYGFPHDFGALFRYAMNNTIDASYHWSAIPKLAPFLFSYWMHSRASQHEAIAHKYAKLIEHCVTEHDALAQEAGATNLLRRDGWMKVFRTEKERDTRLAEAARWNREFGLNYRALDMATLKAEEPHLDHGSLIGGLHWTDPTTVVDPLGLSKAYVALFEKLGGKLAIGDAGTLQQNGAGWTVTLADGTTAEARMSSSRSAPGRTCSATSSAIACRWRSSAAITCITSRRATPCSTTRYSTPSAAISSRRCCRASA